MNIAKLMQEAQKIQKKIKEFDAKEFEYDYKGYIQLKVTGSMKLINLNIKSDLIDKDDPETLQDLIVMAFNEAKDYVDSERSKLESGFNSGAMPKGFF